MNTKGEVRLCAIRSKDPYCFIAFLRYDTYMYQYLSLPKVSVVLPLKFAWLYYIDTF